MENIYTKSSSLTIMIIAVILVIIGIVVGIRAIVPYSDISSNDKKCGDDINCFENETCDIKTKKCIKIKKSHYNLLIISFILFIIAFVIIRFSR